MTDAERIAELQAEVAYLRSELGLSIRHGHVHALCRELKVTRSQATVLLVLRAANSRGLTLEQLDERIPQTHGRPRAGFTVRVFIYQIRKQLGADVIDSMVGGYRLSSSGFALLDTILQIRRVA